MKDTIKMLFFAVTILCSAITMAQSTVTGTVLDPESKAPLPGVNILEAGTSNGTSTNFDGNFSIVTKSKEAKIIVSYVGYLSQEFTVTGSKDLGAITLSPSEFGLQEVNIMASVAVDRKTPVAVSTIKAADIELKLGTQEFPEVLKSTPGVYATKSGGGYGDGRINLRGFSSENVAVMINGVPVNDMENGRVYWSNWAGLGDVTRSLQVQRGLGASKVAVPSIGGTINIITKSTDVETGGNVTMSVGNDGYQKYGATYSTGLMENGLAVSVSAAKIFGNGYVNGTEFNGVNYFLNISKEINDAHKLSFTVFGAKQEHGQRYNRKTIEGYRATEAGGKKFNADWGYHNGQVKNSSFNFYHKPQMSLNHFWDINEKTSLSTALYASFGSGGGRREQGSKIGSDTYRLGNSDQPIDFDTIAEENRALGNLGSSDILNNSNNSHKWYGVLSTLKTKVGDKLTILGGLDGRYYVGSHWYEVSDLLGGQFFLNTTSSDNTFNQALQVGDRFGKDYDATSVNMGLFGQAEYDFSDKLSAFVSTAVSNTTYSKEDFMKYATNDPERKSDKANFVGYSFKGGANYNLDETNNVFANIGYFSKAPFLNGNVFLSDRSTVLNEEALNEKVFSAEIGYGYRSSNFSANVNIYRTSWLDKSLTGTVGNPDPTADRLTYNIPGLDALHQGVELDFLYKFNSKLKATGMVSLGDWTWKNDASGKIFTPDGTLADEVTVYAKDLKVTDAAQTTFAFGLNYKLLPESLIYVDYNYAGNLYASYFITDRQDETNRQDSWEVPSYGLFDLGLKHGFKVGEFDTTLIAKMNNVFNTEYVSDANDGLGSTASSALVYYGSGRTFSVGAKIKF
ncbi:TonB-dependent receptor domain-containing protein [Lacinutrix sp. Bg11-31]|uniref:TonB-dependent receptor n=1 Tax=Lacinutrix sp. Bg11-31 TaxID=2057808 RepID=UPI000C300950|nr:TonB-dependent receptor [Lacinutrix sp. Bg11-31]AUC83124.1 TonB-dependent receptor [Lacinutrix sp. Bg11-31]